MRWAILAILVAMSGCGGPPPPEHDYYLDGIGITVDPGMTGGWGDWIQLPDFDDRVHAVVDAAARYGGGSYEDMKGWVIVFRRCVQLDCGGSSAVGCTYGSGWIEICASFSYRCVEETVLAHEVLHAMIGDDCHTDPRWHDFTAVTDAIEASYPVWPPSTTPVCSPELGQGTSGPTCQPS